MKQRKLFTPKSIVNSISKINAAIVTAAIEKKGYFNHYFSNGDLLEEIKSVLSKKKVHVIHHGDIDDFHESYVGIDESGKEYQFLTNFSLDYERFYSKAIETNPTLAEFGICDIAYSFDQDTGSICQIYEHKALYVRHNLSSLDEFWKHCEKIEKEMRNE